MDAFEVVRVLFQYSRAAKELWVFCDDTDVISLALTPPLSADAVAVGEPTI